MFHSVLLNDFISINSEYFTLKLLLVHEEGQPKVLQLFPPAEQELQFSLDERG